MNWIDAIILLALFGGAAAGFRLGFVTRVLSWLCMLAGAIAGLLVVGPLLDGLAAESTAGTTLLAVTVVLAGAAFGQVVGLLVGAYVRPSAQEPRASRADALLGVVAGLVGVLLLVWLLVPVLARRPGPIAQELSASWFARQLEQHLPQPPDALHALRSLVGEDHFPDVFATGAPTPAVGAPPAASGLAPEVAEAVADSIVRVEGVACSRIQEGTGFVVEPGLVATNAHVVAGESTTQVVRQDGRRIDADVVVYDPDRDLALLAAPGLDRPPLPLGQANVGAVGGVFGHPRGRSLRIAPFQIARAIDATGRNIYGTRLVSRDVLEVAADLAPGDSGAPLVDSGGRVVGVTFAVARDRAGVAYALHPRELAAVLALPRGAVGTGACVRR